METPDQDLQLLESQRQTQSTDNDTDVSSQPEEEQKDESETNTERESNQETTETAETKQKPSSLVHIEFRIEQLYNRHLLLMEMECFIKKSGDKSGKTKEEMTGQDDNEVTEMETIQKELDELLERKEMLEKQGNSSSLEEDQGQEESLDFNTEIPQGGIYILPPPQIKQEEITLEWKKSKESSQPQSSQVETPVEMTSLTTPVDRLSRMSAITKCPSCGEVVSTEVTKKAGEPVWMLCCVCTIFGCVAGCCLIPFLIDRLKTIKHYCPRCRALIHTYQPF